VETYEEEFEGPQLPHLSKRRILVDTEQKMERYKEIGLMFLRSFFRKPMKGGMK
jgi:hypothetical protein